MRTVRVTGPVVEEAIDLRSALIRLAARDGVVCEEERRVIERVRRVVSLAERADLSLAAATTLFSERGIDSPHAARRIRELHADRAHDDGPEPSGPTAMSKAA